MKILVIGGGGREHAIVRALSLDSRIEKLWCAPGNGGIAELAECVPLKATDIAGICEFAKNTRPDLVFVAPDDPLVLGLVDELEKLGIRAFGPDRAAAQIEGSKSFSKSLMQKYGIPTAKYAVFEDLNAAEGYVRERGAPIVIKADGLALGKGVTVAATVEEALHALQAAMGDRVFGTAGSRVVIEECLSGPEVSVLCFSDGESVVPMVSAQDHKRAFDGDKGPNTGGMGAISPSRHYSPELARRCMDEIFLPTVKAMKAEGRPFKGVLYFGLMLKTDGPKVIEYNCRFGDPEAQAVLPRLKTSLLDIILAIMEGRLADIKIEWEPGAAACVVLASGGYPVSYEKGYEISGIKEARTGGAIVYHAGTEQKNGEIVTSGGRVLGVTALGETLEVALEKAYSCAKSISYKNMFYRSDIGKN